MKIVILSLLFVLISCSHTSRKGKDYGLSEFTKGVNTLYGRDGMKKNPELSLIFFQKAAAKGNPVAMDMIGGFHSVGMGGVKKSCAKAMEWFDKAAKLGYSMAVNNLAYTLASCEEKDVRNPYRAKDYMVRLFKKETGVITYLDTMAAIYAELGKFKKAVNYQQNVVDLADLMGLEEARMNTLKKSLRFYKKGKTLPAGYQSDTKTFKDEKN